ncbi:hypothetical protein ES703_47880 [subsurface metagenome]
MFGFTVLINFSVLIKCSQVFRSPAGLRYRSPDGGVKELKKKQPLVERLLELDEERKRLESQIQSGR